MKRVVEPLGQALQGQFAVARLRAGVLRHRRHPRAELRAYPRFLLLIQSARLVHVEDGFDPGRSDVRMLTSRTGGARRPYLDFRDRQGKSVTNA